MKIKRIGKMLEMIANSAVVILLPFTLLVSLAELILADDRLLSGQNKQYQKLYSDSKLDNRGMWIGLSKRESGFGWTDGSALAYINWAAGEPNNWEGSNEDCVEMFSNGYWNDEVNK